MSHQRNYPCVEVAGICENNFHEALIPFCSVGAKASHRDRKSTRLNSSHRCTSYAVFCLKKKIAIHIEIRLPVDTILCPPNGQQLVDSPCVCRAEDRPTDITSRRYRIWRKFISLVAGTIF